MARPRSASQNATRRRALGAAADMRREGLSLSAAARKNGTSPRTILKHTPGNFSKQSGRWHVKAGDTYAVNMQVLTPQGFRTVTVRGSRQRSLLGRYSNTVKRFLNGDEKAAGELEKYSTRAVGEHDLLVDPDELQMMFNRGDLEDWDIYDLGVLV